MLATEDSCPFWLGQGFVLEEGKPHDPINCSRAAEIELPKNAFVYDKTIQQRIRSGEVTVEFNQKTNTISMKFTRMKLPESIRKDFFKSPSGGEPIGSGRSPKLR